jgi:predicted acyl esterase
MTDITDYHDWNFLLQSDVTDNSDEGTKHRVYSKQDHDEVIDRYRDKYLAATSSTQRKNIAQVEMMPHLFNYWKKKGKIYDREKLRIKSIVCSSLTNVFHSSLSL